MNSTTERKPIRGGETDLMYPLQHMNLRTSDSQLLNYFQDPSEPTMPEALIFLGFVDFKVFFSWVSDGFINWGSREIDKDVNFIEQAPQFHGVLLRFIQPNP